MHWYVYFTLGVGRNEACDKKTKSQQSGHLAQLEHTADHNPLAHLAPPRSMQAGFLKAGQKKMCTLAAAFRRQGSTSQVMEQNNRTPNK
eukprot:1157860-Pelagomonas_calceolata.AAC.7